MEYRSSFAVLAAVLLVLTGLSRSEARLTNAVTDWINATQAAVATYGIQNQLSSKYYGLVGLATLKALQAGGAPPTALIAYAGHTILAASFPWSQGKFDVLLAKQVKGLTAAEKAAAKATSVPIAKALLKDREAEASTDFSDFNPAANGTQFAYQFVPNQKFALYPQLQATTPFIASDADINAIVSNTDSKKGPVFQPPKNDYAKTYELGAKNSKARKQYDTDSAYFWADGGNTSAITGHWLGIALKVLPQDFSLEDTALFFARAGAAAYDASIAAWKVKYSTLHWRPVTAFNQGYPGFKADPNWKPLLDTPPHPEYPSGHQATVGAISEVLLKTLGGKDNVKFTISSEGTPWINRTYDSISAAAKEVGDSRVYAGLHFGSANDDGLKLGRLVADKVYDQITAKGVSVRSASTGSSTVAAPVVQAAKPIPAKTVGQKAANVGRRLLQQLFMV